MRGTIEKPTCTPHPRGWLGRQVDGACKVSYEVALLAILFLVVVAPLHRGASQRLDVVRRVDSGHVLIRTERPGYPPAGTVLPVYRFTTQIGTITVQEAGDDTALAAFDMRSFRQPMGRHGLILASDSGGVTINIGADAPLKRNEKLTIFAERKKVGEVLVTDVGAESARGSATWTSRVEPLGLVVSEFAVATQAVVEPGGLIVGLEYGALAALLGTYAWYWIVRRRSPFIAVGERLRGWIHQSGLGRWPLVWHLLVAVPFVWFAAGFLPSLFSVLVTKVAPGVFLWPRFVKQLPLLYGVGGLAYLAYLLHYARSPILAIWKRLGWKPWLYAWLPPGPRRALLWLLQLVIAYAFASTVFDFLYANLNIMLQLGWRGAQVQMHGTINLLDPAAAASWIGGLFRTVGYMLTHAPAIASVESGIKIANYALWSITVVGVLVGYCHSTLGPLWGSHIRNLDFTVVGWITNAFCYPLLGASIWQLVSSYRGEDPLLTGGLPYALMLGLGLLFNLLYTLTIYNLGTKFGVMTDKGVRTTGYYSVVRHPSYTLEAIMFVLLYMNGLSGIKEWWAVSMFAVMYWLRSERDDVFMAAANPDYVKYQKQVPYKFIPGIY